MLRQQTAVCFATITEPRTAEATNSIGLRGLKLVFVSSADNLPFLGRPDVRSTSKDRHNPQERLQRNEASLASVLGAESHRARMSIAKTAEVTIARLIRGDT